MEFISRKLCRFLIMFLTGNSFSLYQSTSLSLCTVFDAISSNMDEVPLINSFANVFCLLRF